MAVHAVVVPLSFTKPPLSLNDHRMHWAQKSRIVRQLREEVVMRMRLKRVRKGAEHVEVTFHYRPRDRRVRDTDNLIATIKPLVDALGPGRPPQMTRSGRHTQPVAGYGLVPDDNPRYVTRPEAVIHAPDKNKGPACWLSLRITYPDTPEEEKLND